MPEIEVVGHGPCNAPLDDEWCGSIWWLPSRREYYMLTNSGGKWQAISLHDGEGLLPSAEKVLAIRNLVYQPRVELRLRYTDSRLLPED